MNTQIVIINLKGFAKSGLDTFSVIGHCYVLKWEENGKKNQKVKLSNLIKEILYSS